MVTLHPIDHTLLQNEASFELLFKQLYTPVCRTIYKITGDKQATEDIAQDAFFVLWEKRSEVNTSVKAYLYRAAINKAFNYLERNKRWVRKELEEGWYDFVPTANTTEQELAFKETEKTIHEALDTLPPACKTVFVMSRMEEMSYKEIAEVLNISIKTVENQIGKALKIMREKVGIGVMMYLVLRISYLISFIS